MPFNRFEDLLVWRKSKDLAKAIYLVSSKGAFSTDFGLSRQMQRAAVSIMSNIAEGHDRGKPSEFHQFLCIALGSCAELRSQLYLSFEIGYLEESKSQELIALTEEVGRMTGALRVSMANLKAQNVKSKP